jgi:Ca2+-binding RTX toxin-like protein
VARHLRVTYQTEIIVRKLRIATVVAMAAALAVPAVAGADEAGKCGVPTTCRGKAVTIAGTNGSETIIGTPGDDVIHGGRGRDRIKGMGGNDTICGGRGDDFIRGGPGVDFIYGGHGNDILEGGGRGDLLDGASGDDVLVPGPGVGGTLEGGKQDDLFWIDVESDNDVFGGPGRDTISFFAAGVRMRVDLFSGHYDSWAPGPLIGSLVFGVEVVVGTDYDDILIGDAGKNWFYGGHGDDDITGNAGRDRLFGEYGDDTLDGGPDWDLIKGGPGTDTCTNGEKVRSCP